MNNNSNIINILEFEYDKLDNEVKVALSKWISYLEKADEFNYDHTSYGLKHYFENASDMLGKSYCVSNDQFKYAMYDNGFEPENYDDENWCFKISEKQKFNWE